MGTDLLCYRLCVPVVRFDSGPHGMTRCMQAFSKAWNAPQKVTLDFSGCPFVSAEAVAIVACLKLRRDCEGFTTTLDWGTIQRPVRQQLRRWQVTRLFGDDQDEETGNSIPILHQRTLDTHALVDYVSSTVVSKMPEMTPELQKRTRTDICELFNNVFQHADSSIGGIAIGQVYPKAKDFQLCVCDGGRGLVDVVQSRGFARESAESAIEWAFGEGNSTCQSCPSGLGLHVLRQFVETNGGKFRIYANNGFYCQEGSRRFSGVLKPGFSGTLVELRFKLDGLKYGLQYS